MRGRTVAMTMRFDVAWFEGLGRTLESDPLYRRIAGRFGARILFEEGASSVLVFLEGGRIGQVQAPPALMTSCDFAIRGEPAAWDDLFAPLPPPRCQSIFALAVAGRMRIEGNWLVVMQNLWALTRLLELMREHDGAAGRAAA